MKKVIYRGVRLSEAENKLLEDIMRAAKIKSYSETIRLCILIVHVLMSIGLFSVIRPLPELAKKAVAQYTRY